MNSVIRQGLYHLQPPNTSYGNSGNGRIKTILSSYFTILYRFYLVIIFISLQMWMSAAQNMAVVMQMLLVQIPLVLIYANVTKDMMEMELIASVRNCVVWLSFICISTCFILTLAFIIFFITDRDECNTTNHGCHVNASCNNFDGSYFCQCNQGFSGNGTNCNGIYLHIFILADTFWILLILYYKLLKHHDDCISGIHLDACNVGMFNHNLFNNSLPVFCKWF